MKRIDLNDVDRLIPMLQKEDSTNATICKILQLVYWVFIPSFVLFSLAPFLKTRDIAVIGTTPLYVLAFLALALYLGKSYRKYKAVDYSLTLVELLKQASKRYRLISLDFLWIIFAYMLISVGLAIESNMNILSLRSHSVVLLILAFAFISGFIYWFFKHKPIHDKANELINELEQTGC